MEATRVFSGRLNETCSEGRWEVGRKQRRNRQKVGRHEIPALVPRAALSFLFLFVSCRPSFPLLCQSHLSMRTAVFPVCLSVEIGEFQMVASSHPWYLQSTTLG